MPETTVLAWKTPGGGAGGPPWLVERAVVIERAPGQKLRSPGATGPHSAGDGCAVRSLRLRVRRHGGFGCEPHDWRHGDSAEPGPKTAAEARSETPEAASATAPAAPAAATAASSASSACARSQGRSREAEERSDGCYATRRRSAQGGAAQGAGAGCGPSGSTATEGSAAEAQGREGEEGSPRASSRSPEEG
jgi:hypothetical protein